MEASVAAARWLPAQTKPTWSQIEAYPEHFEPAPWASAMDDTVRAVRRRFRGDFGLYVSDIRQGYRYAHNAERPFYLASAAKIAIMVEVFRQRARGTISFGERLHYGANEIRDGATRMNPLPLGSRVSIADLLDFMMRASDNSATDMLAERVGLGHVEAGLRADGILGFTRLTYMIDVRRGIFREVDIRADDLTPAEIRTIRWTPVWDPQLEKLNELLGVPPNTYGKKDLLDAYDRFYLTGVNSAPMKSAGRLLELLVTGKLVDAQASLEMLELMTGARTSTARLLGQLPAGTIVAHKTGSQWLHVCDMGAIRLPRGAPLIVVACTERGEVPPSEALIARLTRRAYDLAAADHARQAPARGPVH